MGAGVVASGFGTWERPPVVAADHNERVVKFAGFLKGGEDGGALLVELFRLIEVIADVAARDGVVRQVGRHGNLRWVHARTDADARRIRPVGLMTAIPETEGLARRARGKEGAEVIEGRPGGVMGAALIGAGAVALLRHPNKVARRFQQVGIDQEPGGDEPMEVGALFESPGPLTGQHGRARG